MKNTIAVGQKRGSALQRVKWQYLSLVAGLALAGSAASALGGTQSPPASAPATRRAAHATPQRTAPLHAIERAPAQPQHIYHVVDSSQAALDIERAEYMSAQEQVLTGIVAPERVVHIIDDSKAGHMTAMEQVLVATGGR